MRFLLSDFSVKTTGDEALWGDAPTGVHPIHAVVEDWGRLYGPVVAQPRNLTFAVTRSALRGRMSPSVC